MQANPQAPAEDIPMTARISEFAGLRAAITKVSNDILVHRRQLKEVECLMTNEQLTVHGRRNLDELRLQANNALRQREAALETMKQNFRQLRDEVIAKFTPQLAAAVDTADARFNEMISSPTQRDALAEIETRCSEFPTPEAAVRHEHPMRSDPHTLEGLHELRQLAELARRPLGRLIKQLAAAGGPRSVVRLAPIKSLHRCIEKTQEDYYGDCASASLTPAHPHPSHPSHPSR